MRLVHDETWAAMTIWCEARGEAPEGRLGVAEVIRNRVERRFMSDGTVAGACLWPYQFTCWNTKDPNRRLAAILDTEDPIVLDCFTQWDRALAGSSLVRGGLLYYNPAIVGDVPADWGIVHRVATIGNHAFYRPGAA
jgi:N-acetylmuramoyl-L-alanine amidase